MCKDLFKKHEKAYKWIPSPNYSSRNGKKIDMIVLHHTATYSELPVITWFQDIHSDVSAHYIICKNGSVINMVKEKNRAWHCRGYNSSSIGIECVSNNQPLTKEQNEALVGLIKELFDRYGLNAHDVQGHGYLPKTSTVCPSMLFGSKGIMSFIQWKKDNLPEPLDY